jgi:hypothetical protein
MENITYITLDSENLTVNCEGEPIVSGKNTWRKVTLWYKNNNTLVRRYQCTEW